MTESSRCCRTAYWYLTVICTLFKLMTTKQETWKTYAYFTWVTRNKNLRDANGSWWTTSVQNPKMATNFDWLRIGCHWRQTSEINYFYYLFTKHSTRGRQRNNCRCRKSSDSAFLNCTFWILSCTVYLLQCYKVLKVANAWNGLIVENNTRPTMFNNGYLIESKRLAFWFVFYQNLRNVVFAYSKCCTTSISDSFVQLKQPILKE